MGNKIWERLNRPFNIKLDVEVTEIDKQYEVEIAMAVIYSSWNTETIFKCLCKTEKY